MSTMQERMRAGRERAKAYRDSGGGTVRVFATTIAMYRACRGDADLSTWEQSNAESRAKWEGAVLQYLEDMRADLFGQQWEGFEL